MPRFHKLPHIIEAQKSEVTCEIETLEGVMRANVGDYVIVGIKGERYPCKPDIFERTYAPVPTGSARPLYGPGDTRPRAYQCAVCARLFSGTPDNHREMGALAEACCAPCARCGGKLAAYGTCTNAECRRARDAEHEAKLLARAQRIPEAEYDGPVTPDGDEGRYFANTSAYRDWLADEGRSVPETVWACTIHRPRINLDTVLESVCEDLLSEDVYERLVDVSVLSRAVDAWNEKQTAESWYIDYKRAVVLEKGETP
jgi:hypothetical protein